MIVFPSKKATLLSLILLPLFSCAKIAFKQEFPYEGVDNLMVREYVTRGLVGLPVWQVVSLEGDKRKVVLTVERVWQEAMPGFPQLSVNRDGDLLLADEPNSYVFSLSKGVFLKNEFPSNVYEGNFRKN